LKQITKMNFRQKQMESHMSNCMGSFALAGGVTDSILMRGDGQVAAWFGNPQPGKACNGRAQKLGHA